RWSTPTASSPGTSPATRGIARRTIASSSSTAPPPTRPTASSPRAGRSRSSGSFPASRSCRSRNSVPEDRERALTVHVPVVEGDQRGLIGRRLGGEMGQAGRLQAPDGLGQQCLARRLVVEDAREQAIDALVPLALGPERP